MTKNDQFYYDFFKLITRFEIREYDKDTEDYMKSMFDIFFDDYNLCRTCDVLKYPTKLEQAKDIYEKLLDSTIPAKFIREYSEKNSVITFGGDGVNPKSQITIIMSNRNIFKGFGLDNIRVRKEEIENILLFFYIDLEYTSPSKKENGMIYIGDNKCFEIWEVNINSFWCQEDEIKVYDGKKYVEGKNGIWPNEKEEK